MQFKYRVLKSSWGIAIDIAMDILQGNAACNEAGIEVVPEIKLVMADMPFDKSLLPYLLDGIRQLAPFIHSKTAQKPVCFQIHQIHYNYTDFQANGLTYAIQGAIYQAFGEEPAKQVVRFDEERNEYIFE